MCLFDGPRDVSKHIAELEARWGGPTFDHLKGDLCGWRSERHLVDVHDGEQSNHDSGEPGMLQRLFTKSRDLLWAFGGSAEMNRSKPLTK
jgi:hypothetical protein